MLTRQSRIVINASLLITILVSIIVELIFYFIEHSFSLILFNLIGTKKSRIAKTGIFL